MTIAPDLPTLQESTILHAARCAAAAKTNPDRTYWNGILEDAVAQYRARGGERIMLEKGWPWRVKVPAGWLTPDDARAVKTKGEPRPGTSDGPSPVAEQEVRNAERDVADAARAYLALRRRLTS